MRQFKVEGWYRYKGDKYFEQLIVYSCNTEGAIDFFEGYFGAVFYKIDIIEIFK
ncbi:hypothetical protein PHG11b_25 [Flavobacterium phage 11b]|uniref:hypothetical protein n=1 Tax=Flavobacterium phage 11b TaxID=294631 RepID=UPI0000444137|nr:hypothetical protein PHG11b_25 [Flavobacterium phage 11b]CAH56652.1 hypothetical protein PHG11b_25 [Flavobacterium phage 11b]